MTARVTTLKGASAGAYYVEALPNYYLDSGEPKGVWHGRGAELLGLDGEIIDGEFLRVMAGLHPRRRGDVALGRVYGEDSVRGFDVTASAPKSVSVLFAVGGEDTRRHVLAAHDTAVESMLGSVEDHAHTRFRVDGEVAVVDAEGVIAATFRQHTSRALDPQLHTHVVIANRVRSPDGRWLALDARALKVDQRTLSAIYHATLRCELTARLGVEWDLVDNGIAEIAQMPRLVLDEFSARTADIGRRVDEKLDRFVDNFDRDPTPRERWRLEREAVLETRPAKAHALDAHSLHDGWVDQLETLGHDPARLISRAVGRVRSRGIDDRTGLGVIDEAVGALGERQSTWRPAELTRELAAAIPTDTGVDAADLVAVLDSLTRVAIDQRCVDISRPVPSGVALRRDGRPVTESIAQRALTTPEILAQEEWLLAWAERRMTRDGRDRAEAIERSRVELTGPQAETAAAVAGDADLVLVVGPAGTGKTTALAPAVEQLQADGRPVFGVAPSAAAADVLAFETEVSADTIDKLLTEHALHWRPPDYRYDLPVGATVVVDEAAMVGTDKLDALARLADDRGWRLALVGDPMQFSAVGRGGMFEHLVDTHGAIELDQVHRFTADWERAASLRLRRGDPTVADLYDLHGRLHGGTATRMQHDALAAWWHARHEHVSVVLAAPTTDTVQRLNGAAQQLRIDAGELNTAGRTLDTGADRLHVGDEIVTRRNHRHLHTDQGLPIRNRDQWIIDAIARDGSITAHGPNGTIRLPADYVAAHVELGYAQTSHAVQGRTVEHSILLLDGPTDVRGIYVPMTRGQHANDAYIVIPGEQTAVDVFADAVTRNWIDQPALARQTELTGTNHHQPGTLPPEELRALLDQQAQLVDMLDQLRFDLEQLPRQHLRLLEDRAIAANKADAARASLERATATLAQHDRPFRRRGHEPEIRAAHHAIETLPDRIRAHSAEIAEITTRMHDIDRRLTNANHLDQRSPAIETQLADIGDRLGDDRHNRSRTIRRDPPQHAIETLGQRPPSRELGRAWDNAAGHLDQHHTAYNHTNHPAPDTGRDLPAGYHHSRTLTDNATTALHRTLTRHHELTRTIEGPSHEISR